MTKQYCLEINVKKNKVNNPKLLWLLRDRKAIVSLPVNCHKFKLIKNSKLEWRDYHVFPGVSIDYSADFI